jgi:hypothetical protein
MGAFIMKKRVLSVTCCLLIVLMLLCGCGGGDMSADDAKSYTQAVLDASYKSEFDDYMEWTDSTEEEVEQLYEDSLDTTMSETGFENLGLSDKLVEKYRQLFRNVMNDAEYTVKKATEDDEGYLVEIEVEPFIAFAGITDEVTASLEVEMETAGEESEISVVNEKIYQRMYDKMEDRLAFPSYGDATTITVRVQQDENGTYYISEEDLLMIDDALFPAEEF